MVPGLEVTGMPWVKTPKGRTIHVVLEKKGETLTERDLRAFDEILDLIKKEKQEVVRGYGNAGDSSPKAQESGDVDLPHPTKSITRKILDTLPPAKRNTIANRRLAQQNGWTDEEFEDWVNGSGGSDEGVRDG